jgi:type 1 glutamine amidotransferase
MPPRVLLYSKTTGFRHDSIEEGARALARVCNERGWEVLATEDPTSFHAARLARFDLALFLNTNGEVLDEKGREALTAFVRSGKGFAGVHGAAATEPDWPWFGALVGATFKTHPAVQPAVVTVADAEHPATRHLPASWRRTDEWYAFRENPRDTARVLLTLDESSYEPGDGTMGADHPLAWCHDFEGGRAFYTALGHTGESYRETPFLEHLAGGIAWALGSA